MKTRRDVFQAIADPTRREIINLIAMETYNVNAIAEKFDVTRQAISLHIQILADCGLLVIKKQGRERLIEAKLGPLGEVAQWIEPYKQHYEKKLDALETYIEKIKKERDGKFKK